MRPTPTLRGEVLARYAKDWLLDLQDIFDFVREPTVALRASVGSTEAISVRENGCRPVIHVARLRILQALHVSGR